MFGMINLKPNYSGIFLNAVLLRVATETFKFIHKISAAILKL